MRAVILVIALGMSGLAFPGTAIPRKTMAKSVHPERERAVSLLRQASELVIQLPAGTRSTALNSLATAWQPISPLEARRSLIESFAAASSLPLEQRGEEQAEAVRRMAAFDLRLAREFSEQILSPEDGEYTAQTNWRYVAWDGLLQEMRARANLRKTVQQAKSMSEGLPDTIALSMLVHGLVGKDPQGARDLVAQGLQQFSIRPITVRRFSTFPRALIALAEVDRPFARRLFEALFSYLPDLPTGADADTDAGKQRIAFRREAGGMLLRKAARIDPLLAQEWKNRLGGVANTEADGETITSTSLEASGQGPRDQGPRDQGREDSGQQAATLESTQGDSGSGPTSRGEHVWRTVNAIQEPDAKAQAMLRFAQKMNRQDPQLAKELLNTARSQASTISDPEERGRLYAKAARTGGALHDPHVEDDLSAAEGAFNLAQVQAKDEEARTRLSGAEMAVMQALTRKLDVESAERRALEFSDPTVRFRALLIVAERWWAVQSGVRGPSKPI